MNVGQPKFEQSALEQDMQRLAQEVLARKGQKESLAMPEREIVKEVLSSQIEDQPYVTPSFSSSNAQASTSSPLPQYMNDESAEIKLKVEQLINETFHKGVSETIKEARKMNPFILDAFHDALTSRVYDELKERKLI